MALGGSLYTKLPSWDATCVLRPGSWLWSLQQKSGSSGSQGSWDSSPRPRGPSKERSVSGELGVSSGAWGSRQGGGQEEPLDRVFQADLGVAGAADAAGGALASWPGRGTESLYCFAFPWRSCSLSPFSVISWVVRSPACSPTPQVGPCTGSHAPTCPCWEAQRVPPRSHP